MGPTVRCKMVPRIFVWSDLVKVSMIRNSGSSGAESKSSMLTPNQWWGSKGYL